MAIFSNALDGLRGWWQTATPMTRAMATGLSLMLVVGLIVAGSLASSPDYKPIYRGVSGKDASAIEGVLRDHSIAMKFDDKDGTVSVPSKDESNATMYIEAAGLPSKDSDVVGIEGLDKIGMGTTSEVERQRILAANEGELSRKLMRLDPVQSAAVSISPGSSATLFGDDTQPTASVILTLKSGESLSGGQVKGIVNLIAHAVSGLTPQNVTLTDQTGVPLWKDNGAGGNAYGDGQPGDENTKFSENERKRVQSLLDETLGPHKALVTVNAELNFDQTSTDSLEHTPAPGSKNGLPVSVSENEESYSGAGAAPVGGVAGAGSNLNVSSYTTGGASGGGGKYSNTHSVTNYELDVKKTHTEVAQGEVKKMSVAALVDTSVPSDTIPKIKDVIATAIGATAADPSRYVSVQQIAFDTSAAKAQTAQMQSAMSQQLWSNVARALAVCVVAVVLLVLLMKSSGRRLGEPQLALAGGGANVGLLHSAPEAELAEISGFSGGYGDGREALEQSSLLRGTERAMEERPLTVEDVLSEMPDIDPSSRPRRRRSNAPSIEENQDLKMESIRSMVNSHPESVALLLKGWMAEAS